MENRDNVTIQAKIPKKQRERDNTGKRKKNVNTYKYYPQIKVKIFLYKNRLLV